MCMNLLKLYRYNWCFLAMVLEKPNPLGALDSSGGVNWCICTSWNFVGSILGVLNAIIQCSNP
jgi:hypothetical protein